MTSNNKEVRISSIELITSFDDLSVVVVRFVGCRYKIKVTIRNKIALFYKGNPEFIYQFLCGKQGKMFVIQTLMEWGLIHVN